MDTLAIEREGTAIGNALFQQIIADLKNTSPLWEDFIAKANKLYACLRTAIQAIAAYLDAFQKIADAATNSKGASKEIGTALTRVCLRQKSVETRLKTFASAIMDCLILPLQDKVEDWKRQVVQLDKDHAKEYKRCRAELKKRSQDTLRLQKKARKSSTQAMMGANTMNVEKSIKSMMESSMMDVTQRRTELEDVERKSLRAAMLEERMRYCAFVNLLQPVVKEEYEVMYELGHLQEAMETVTNVTREPHVLPAASEELIQEIKAPMNYLYPDSPSHTPGSNGSNNGNNNNGCSMSTSSNSQGCSNSLGSRKSSVCSISSMNSSASGGPVAGNGGIMGGAGASGSPSHQPHHQQQFQRSISQLISPVIRLKSGESSDSGFCSSPALTTQTSSGSGTIPTLSGSTWPSHAQEEGMTGGLSNPGIAQTDRPHTISSAYEKGHQRPALTVYTFQNPDSSTGGAAAGGSGGSGPVTAAKTSAADIAQRASNSSIASRPPIPVRCSSLERPLTSVGVGATPSSLTGSKQNLANLMPRQCPSPLPAHITKDHPQLQPTYVNMSELANMAAMKMQLPAASSGQQQQLNSPVLSTASSITNDSSAATHHPSSPDVSSSTSQAATPMNSAPETNHNSPTTPVVSHDYDSGFSMDSKTISPEGDTKSAGSVIEKASLFERLEVKKPLVGGVATPMAVSGTGGGPLNRSESLYGRRNEEIYRACGTLDSDKLAEDSIQELNDLIGELDLFQKEHELSTLLAKCQPPGGSSATKIPQLTATNANGHPIEFPTSQSSTTGSIHSADEVDATTLRSKTSTTPYEGQSIGSAENGSFTGSFDDDTNGYENPSFRYLHENHRSNGQPVASVNGSQEIVHIQDEELSGDTQRYLQENSEIVTLRCKDSQRQSMEQNYASIGLGGIGNDNLIVQPGVKGKVNGGTVGEANVGGPGNTNNPQQRLSSFQQSPQRSSFNGGQQASGIQTLKRPNNSCDNPVEANGQLYHINGNEAPEPAAMVVQVSPDGKLRGKPTVSPRPTSLSGTRLARRSSVNSTKPPPPVRRSSSVTPSPHQLMGSSPLNLSQQNLANAASSDSLPPPPAYLLDSNGQSNQSVAAAAGNVAGAIKALTDLRHTPASPGVLRRAQMLLQNHQQQQQPAANNAQTLLPQNSSASLIYHHEHQLQQHQQMLLQQQQQPPTSNYYQNHFNNGQENASFAPNSMHQLYSSSNYESTTVVYHHESPVINGSCSNHLNSSLSASQSSLPPPPAPGDLDDMMMMHNASLMGNNDHHHRPNGADTNHNNHYYAPAMIMGHDQIGGQQQSQLSQRMGNNGDGCVDVQDGEPQTNHRSGTASPSQGGMFTPPKPSKMLSFRNQSPGSGKGQSGSNANATGGSSSLIAQLSARLTPSKQQQLHNERFNEAKMYAQTLQQQQGQGGAPATTAASGGIYGETGRQVGGGPAAATGGESIYEGSNTASMTPPGSNQQQRVLAKTTSVGFIENLNAKLAEQRLSGKAYAVRSLINSKALPDPRVCHESLMDQIKRGASLRQNGTTNDRSAPKIH